MLKLNRRKFSTSTIAVVAPVKEDKENRSRGLPLKPECNPLRQGKDVKHP